MSSPHQTGHSPPSFLLIHSPLVGPMTWQRVAEVLRVEGEQVVVPALARPTEPPYWSQHVASVVAALPAGTGAVWLVGHSGAGPLLPAIAAALPCPVAGYLFVDSDLPRDGASRLDRFEEVDAAAFRARAQDGLIPPWTEADLADVLPDATVRKRFVAELAPLPLALYEEALPVFAGWPDAPCGYLHLSAPYDKAAAEARERNWPLVQLPSGHFQMLVEPGTMGRLLWDLAEQMGGVSNRGGRWH